MNKNSRTYRLAFWFLRCFCPPHLLEEIEGDLLQRYERDLKSSDHSKWSQGAAGAAAVAPGADTARPPHPLSDIYTELVKLFRNL